MCRGGEPTPSQSGVKSCHAGWRSQSYRMKLKRLIQSLVYGGVLFMMTGCATWEAKLDQRAKWKKFREESLNSPTTPFKRWPPEQ